MAPLTTSNDAAVDDDNDSLYDYNPNIDEIFREIDTSTKIDINDTSKPKKDSKDSGTALGLDEEIKITKKRKPIAKLDDRRYDAE